MQQADDFVAQSAALRRLLANAPPAPGTRLIKPANPART